MRFFKNLFFFLLSFCLYTWAVKIDYPSSGAYVRGNIQIQWSDGVGSYTLQIKQGSNEVSYDTESSTYLFNTNLFQDGGVEIYVIDKGDNNAIDQRIVTIDNTPPASDLKIMGSVVVGGTISYSGSWSDNLSGPIIVKEAYLYVDTDTETSNAVLIKELGPGEIPQVVGSDSYSGSFVVPEGIGQYNYLFVKIKVWDQAVDQSGNGNETIDWSDPLPIPHITGINITSPQANAKCRDTIKIAWTITGTPNGDERYRVYRSGDPNPIYEGTEMEFSWDTMGVSDGRYTIKVVEIRSGIESTVNIIVDNTAPIIDFVSIVPPEPDGIIPDVDVGNIGRYRIGIKKSGWYKTYPSINLRIRDPQAADGTCAGIKGVAYRFVVDGDEKEWQTQTYTGQQSIELLISVNFEGENIYLEVIAVDDAQYSEIPASYDPNYNGEVYNALGYGNNNGNYSTIFDSSEHVGLLNVDITPPQITSLRIDKLPDGPIIGQIHWYNSVPIVYLECKDNIGGSGVLEDVVAFTVDGSDIDDFPLIDNTGVYSLDILDNKDSDGKVERVVFKNYLQAIGIDESYQLYFPVFNSYGKQIRVRIWDKAGNISTQFVDNPWYIEKDAQGRIIRQEQVSLYVDTVPPDTRVTLSGIYMPTQFKDIGTYERNYTDTWRHNKDFSRPEDCPPPSNYPNDYIDYIYYASLNNRFLNPLSLTLNSVDSLWQIFELTNFSELTNKRPFTILPGHPDYDPRYDFLFSDFKDDNFGSGVLTDLTGIQYRLTYNNSDILTDLRKVIEVENKYYAVGEKGVILESSDGINWTIMTFEDTSNLYGIAGTSSDNIWACGENGRIIRFDGNRWNREDTGINWNNIGIDESNLPTFYSILIDNNNVLVAGTGGIVLKYNGTSWSKENTNVYVNLYGLGKIGNDIYAVGASGTILKYDGTNWNQENSGINDDLYVIFGTDTDDIYVFGNIEVLSKIGYLHNSGYGWNLSSTNISSIKNNKKRVPLYSITSDNSGNIYVVGKNGTVLKYDGANWTDISPTGIRDTIYGVSETDGSLVIVGGSGLTGKGDGTSSGWNINNKWEQWKNYTGPISLPYGITSIEYFAIDYIGNEEDHHKIVDPGRGTVKDTYDGKGTGNLRSDDNVPDPEIIIEPLQPDGENGWYINPVKIKFTYTDENDWLDPLPTGEIGSGLKGFQYVAKTSSTTPDDSEFNDYTLGTKINITTEGTYYVFYRAVDNIGNKALSFSILKIDGTKPTVSLTFSNGIFKLTGYDSGSGVEKVCYKFILYDGTEILNEITGSSTTFTTPDGINRIEYWAVDYAGNEGDHEIRSISMYDSTPPTTSITYSQPYYLSGTTLYITSGSNTASTVGKTQFTIISTDPKVNNFASGIPIGYPKYRIETSIPDWTNYTGPFNIESTDTKIEAFAIDGAGNTGNTAVLSFVVDDDAPVIQNISFDRSPDTNTNWYNSITGRPNIVITSEDTGSGIYEIGYSFDGVNYSVYTGPVPISEGKDLSLTIYVNAIDNLRNTGTTISDLPTVNVDITRPISSIEILAGRKFKITSIDNISGIKTIWYQFDNNTPISVDFSTSELTAETEEIDIPVETKQIKYWAIDNAGNIEVMKIHDIKQIKISGYVKDYSGNPVSNVRVILTGEATRSTLTDTYGYYEFTDLSSIGIYYIIPSVQVALPAIRGYDGTATTDLTNQDFIITNGWRFKEYDFGNTNDYYFKSNTVLPSYSQIILDWSVGLGGDILTGDLDNDGKLDLIIKGDYTGVVYNYIRNIGYTQKGDFATTYNLGILDSIDLDNYLEIVLTGTGQDLFKIYDKNFTELNSVSYSGTPLPPTNTNWGVRIAENNMLFAGYGVNLDGSLYTNVMLYDYLNNQVIWTKNIPQRIEPDKLNICIRGDNKVMLILGGINDTSDLKVYALDVFTGDTLWTKTLAHQKGRIITLVSSVYGGISQDIIGIRFSTSINQVPLTIYRFDPMNGNILGQSSLTVYTQDIKYALSDIDNDNVKELLISDSYENLYLIDMNQFILEKQGIGKVWACVDFDGKAGKEIIVSAGTYVKVLDYNLNEIMSYNLQDNIKKVIVSEINNDGIIEIIVSSATKTYILRPTTTLDLPNAPTNLRCELGINCIYIYWNYVPSTGTLKGFKIYRSLDSSNWGSPIQIINDPNARTAIDTPPSLGMWYYKVSAFNDFGEVSCINPTSYLIEYRETVPEEGGGGCFIASVCFGENSWQVKILKEFRDKVLMKFEGGKKFVRFYYRYSPYLKEYIKDKIVIKTFIKTILYPIVFVTYFIVHYLIFGILLCFIFVSIIWKRAKQKN